MKKDEEQKKKKKKKKQTHCSWQSNEFVEEEMETGEERGEGRGVEWQLGEAVKGHYNANGRSIECRSSARLASYSSFVVEFGRLLGVEVDAWNPRACRLSICSGGESRYDTVQCQPRVTYSLSFSLKAQAQVVLTHDVPQQYSMTHQEIHHVAPRKRSTPDWESIRPLRDRNDEHDEQQGSR
ncbi:hypothetical protein M431DRAFT_476731 [Trichoderma harzianum CBS 226.95]|uniref:Uncharacterized protein n=1 Tax=Trichoderma harzianum CBS 226.95 TaxID=983964 RepID=A0A2T4AT36_TRIHA|nr:hypothetical protein M431DRAFT_476731 [Trichoderma harzianum CBS 226.95]PTB60211.1 hypothetical protein M431DRAFT_476731 [Trichoderma harzianum CBS 226.95]